MLDGNVVPRCFFVPSTVVGNPSVGPERATEIEAGVGRFDPADQAGQVDAKRRGRVIRDRQSRAGSKAV